MSVAPVCRGLHLCASQVSSEKVGFLPSETSTSFLPGINPQLTGILNVLNSRHLKMGMFSSVVVFSIEGWDLGGREKQILFS